MRISLSTGLLGGIGFFGRFIIALVIIMVLKTLNKNDRELDRGLRLLIVFGVMAAILLAVLFVVWLFVFGAGFMYLPDWFAFFSYW